MFSKSLILGGILLSLNAGATSLKNDFAAPPSEYRAMINTHGWQLTNTNLPNWLGERHAGGSVIDAQVAAVPGEEHCINPKYLDDPVVFQNLRDTMDRMKANDQKVWIYDELGYPSGSAGGRVLDGHPEYAVQAMQCRSLQTSGQPLEIEAKNALSCRAFPQRDGVLDLTAGIDLSEKVRAGAFSWEPPAGNWTVCLLEHIVPDTWKRHNVARRNVNIMDRDAIARFIEITHERYAKELGSQLDDVVLFFTDEPQLGATEPWMDMALREVVPSVQWCDELPIAFEKQKGYPITDALPALFHNVGPTTGHYRHDFYDVYSDLIAENYFGQIEAWCHEHNVPSSGHMLLEESLLFSPMFSGSTTKNWARQDLPGVDQLVLARYKTMGGWEGDCGIVMKEDFSIKTAASIAALTGKQGVFSESFAAVNFAKLDNLAQASKGMVAWQFACGVTHMCTYTLQDELSPAEYAEFSDFVGRMALLCRRGQPVTDVAVLIPEASVWAYYNPPNGGMFERYIKCNPEVMQIDNAFRETCHQLAAHQRDFEVFTEDLLSKAVVNDGRLELAGQSFAFLVLPEARMLSEAAMQKIETFAASGGRIIFTGALPFMTPAKGEDETIHQRAKYLLAAHGDRTRVVQDEALFEKTAEWMAQQVPPEIRWDGPAAIRLAHQRESEREIILLANPSEADAAGKFTCAFGGEASLWNPETGEVAALGKLKSGQAIDITIPADSARFVIFERAPPAFEVGEKLSYSLGWQFIVAGKATLEVLPDEEVDGRKVRSFEMTAKTGKVASRVFKVRDKLSSLAEYDVSRSLGFSKIQREGKTKRDVSVEFDWENLNANYTERLMPLYSI